MPSTCPNLSLAYVGKPKVKVEGEKPSVVKSNVDKKDNAVGKPKAKTGGPIKVEPKAEDEDDKSDDDDDDDDDEDGDEDDSEGSDDDEVNLHFVIYFFGIPLYSPWLEFLSC